MLAMASQENGGQFKKNVEAAVIMHGQGHPGAALLSQGRCVGAVHAFGELSQVTLA